jgi:threonine dehydratase
MTHPSLPVYADIEAATAALAPVAVRTHLLSSPALDAQTGARVFIKPEVLQRTGSFKFRGAYNRLSLIPQSERLKGVVAFSSGNHAQGVAAAAQLLGLPATIVMPADAPVFKRERTKSYGASVVLYDRDRESREEIAQKIAAESGATLVPPFDDPRIIAGQGTVGLEIAEDLHALGLAADVVSAPASGGGLMAGIALAIHHHFPQARLFTAEPEGYDDHARSLASGQRQRHQAQNRTFCDALMALEPGELTFAINRKLVAGGVIASDAEVTQAMAFAFRELKLVAEPGGSVALAALLAGRMDVRGKTVVIVLSGGNVDAGLYADAIREGAV